MSIQVFKNIENTFQDAQYEKVFGAWDLPGVSSDFNFRVKP
jgi:hypothetical protein